MPRHRRERVPRHRALRLAGYPARRVQVTAALVAPSSALDRPVSDRPVADRTGPDRTGLDRTGLDARAPNALLLADAELPGIRLDGRGLAGTGLGSGGLDDTETLPLPVLMGARRSQFNSSVHGPADDDAADDGPWDNDAEDDGRWDDGAADDDAVGYDLPAEPLWGDLLPGDLLARDRPAGHRAPRFSRSRRRPALSTAAVGQPAVKQHGVAHGLLVTPWFAAAAGFVIAASLWIYSPHPKLTFPAIAIGNVPCAQTGCAPEISKQGSRQLTIASGEPLSRSKSRGHTESSAEGRDSTAASGLTFSYVVIPADHGNYAVIISVTGKHAIKNWKLSFVLPGARILYVIGAQWKADGSDGGVASPGSDNAQWRGPGAEGDQGNQVSDRGDGDTSGHGQLLAGFTVIASGKAVGPSHCYYDGAACTFRKLTSH